jgi:hypothetical protein
MENLGSDVTIEILRKLSGTDILDTCRTSKKFYEACKSSRYNNLWKEKLYEEYKISYNGNDAYDKYVETEKLYKKVFYQITSGSDNDNSNYLFDNKENAIEFAVSSILENDETLNYYKVRSEFEWYNIYKVNSYIKYELEEITLTILDSISNSKEKDRYNYIKKELEKEFPDQDVEFYERLLYNIFSREDIEDFKFGAITIPKEDILLFMKRVV